MSNLSACRRAGDGGSVLARRVVGDSVRRGGVLRRPAGRV